MTYLHSFFQFVILSFIMTASSYEFADQLVFPNISLSGTVADCRWDSPTNYSHYNMSGFVLPLMDIYMLSPLPETNDNFIGLFDHIYVYKLVVAEFDGFHQFSQRFFLSRLRKRRFRVSISYPQDCCSHMLSGLERQKLSYIAKACGLHNQTEIETLFVLEQSYFLGLIITRTSDLGIIIPAILMHFQSNFSGFFERDISDPEFISGLISVFTRLHRYFHSSGDLFADDILSDHFEQSDAANAQFRRFAYERGLASRANLVHDPNRRGLQRQALSFASIADGVTGFQSFYHHNLVKVVVCIFAIICTLKSGLSEIPNMDALFSAVRASNITRSVDFVSSLTSAMRFLGDLFPSFLDRGFQVFTSSGVNGLIKDVAKLEFMMENISSLGSTFYYDGGEFGQLKIFDFVNICDKAESDFRALSRAPLTLTAAARSSLDSIGTRIAAVKTKWAQYWRIEKPRTQPFAVFFHGPPRCGKTLLTNTLIRQYCCDHGMDGDEVDHMCYTMPIGSNFFDGFRTDKIFIIADELGSIRPGNGVPDDSHTNLIRIINNTSFVPQQAALENKGVHPCLPALVVGTSNKSDAGAHVTLTNPEALSGRFKMVVGVHPHAAVSDALGRIDADKVKLLRNPFDAWSFSITDGFPQPGVPPRMLNAIEFLKLFRELVTKHEEEQIEFLKTNRHNKACPECHLLWCGCNHEPLPFTQYRVIGDGAPVIGNQFRPRAEARRQLVRQCSIEHMSLLSSIVYNFSVVSIVVGISASIFYLLRYIISIVIELHSLIFTVRPTVLRMCDDYNRMCEFFAPIYRLYRRTHRYVSGREDSLAEQVHAAGLRAPVNWRNAFHIVLGLAGFATAAYGLYRMIGTFNQQRVDRHGDANYNQVDVDNYHEVPYPNGALPQQNVWARSGLKDGIPKDANSLNRADVLTDRCAHLIAYVTDDNGRVSTVRGTGFYCGDTFITSAHTFDGVLGKPFKLSLFTQPVGSINVSTVVDHMIEPASHIVVDPERDIAIIRHPLMIKRRDIKIFFQSHANQMCDATAMVARFPIVSASDVGAHNRAPLEVTSVGCVEIAAGNVTSHASYRAGKARVYVGEPNIKFLRYLSAPGSSFQQGDSGSMVILRVPGRARFFVGGLHTGVMHGDGIASFLSLEVYNGMCAMFDTTDSTISYQCETSDLCDVVNVGAIIEPDDKCPLTGKDKDGTPYESVDPLMFEVKARPIGRVLSNIAPIGRLGKVAVRRCKSDVAVSPVRDIWVRACDRLSIEVPNLVAPVLFGCSVENPAVAAYKTVRHYLKVVQTRVDNFNLKDLCFVVDNFVDHVFRTLPASEFSVLGVVSKHVAINGQSGVAFCDAMDMSKSAGYPYFKTKKELLNMHHDGTYTLPPSIDDRVNMIESRLRSGIADGFIFTGFRKDEPIVLEKLIKRGPRLILGSPIECMVLVRRFLMGFSRLMQRNRMAFMCAVGGNHQCMEWSVFAKYLLSKECHIDGDYANWDMTLLPCVCSAIRKFIVTVCSRSSRYASDELCAIDALLTSVLNPYVELDGYLYHVFGTNPSGQPLTTFVNCIGNIIVLAYSFYQLTGEDFFRHCSALVYGDDNVVGVPRDFVDRFNIPAISDLLSRSGIIYTAADKTSDLKHLTAFHDLSFLKRKFILRDGVYLAPRELKSIVKSGLMVTRSSHVDVVKQYESICQMLVDESYHLEPEQSQIIRQAVVETCDHFGIPRPIERFERLWNTSSAEFYAQFEWVPHVQATGFLTIGH